MLASASRHRLARRSRSASQILVGRRAPPLSAVEAFVVAARCLNFRSAAEQLSLSPSALTRRIQGLEAYIGAALFERFGHGVALTGRGAEYLADVEPALRAIRCAGQGRISRECEGPLRIAVSQSIATNWLYERLPSLMADTGVELEVHTSRDTEVLRSGCVDLAIWGGLRTADDLLSTVLFNADAVAVGRADDAAAFDLAAGHIAEHRLLGVTSPQGLWERWLQRQHDARAPRIVEYGTLELMYEAACAGLGIALAIPVVSEPHLRQGRLRAVCSQRRALSESYRLYFSSLSRAHESRVERVSEWLRREVARSCRDFDAWWRAQKHQRGC